MESERRDGSADERVGAGDRRREIQRSSYDVQGTVEQLCGDTTTSAAAAEGRESFEARPAALPTIPLMEIVPDPQNSDSIRI